MLMLLTIGGQSHSLHVDDALAMHVMPFKELEDQSRCKTRVFHTNHGGEVMSTDLIAYAYCTNEGMVSLYAARSNGAAMLE
jgi:hypothetical protein